MPRTLHQTILLFCQRLDLPPLLVLLPLFFKPLADYYLPDIHLKTQVDVSLINFGFAHFK